jgi:hypothetical protein
VKARSIPGGTWGGYFLLIAITRPSLEHYPTGGEHLSLLQLKILKKSPIFTLTSEILAELNGRTRHVASNTPDRN